MSTSRLVSIQVGQPRTIGPEDDRWNSAIFKDAVTGPVWLGRLNVEGDRQANLKVHGGPDQSVLGYSAAHYPLWRDELGLPDFAFGAFGENFTIEGLDETTVCLGDSYAVGEAVIQVTAPRGPCWKIARRHGIPTLTAMVQKTGRSGWYHRTLQEGFVEAGQKLRLVDRPHPEWPISRVASVSRSRDPEILAVLAGLPEFAARHRAEVEERLARFAKV